MKSKLGHVKNYRRNEITFSEGLSYHIHCHVVYLCENHSISKVEIENNLHDLWNEACRKNRFGWSKRGMGLNVMEGENVGIYGLKKEHTFEGFENVKKILTESKKRTKRKFKEKNSYSIGDLEQNIFFLFNRLKLKFIDDIQNRMIKDNNKLMFWEKFLV